QSQLRSQPAVDQAGARPDFDDHRPDEEPVMIPGLSAVEKTGPAFATLEGMANIAGPATKAPNVAPEVSFASALATATENAVGTLRGAETLSLKAVQGEVETREVVDAVMSAEQTLQAAIAIRDKIVSSYLEVARMAI